MADQSNEPGAVDLTRDDGEIVGRLRWYHWAVLLISVCLTIYIWHSIRATQQARAAQSFDRQVSQITDQFVDRLQRYEDALWASVAKIAISGGVPTLEKWHQYTASKAFLSQFPATSSLALISYVESDKLDQFLLRQRTDQPAFNLRPQRVLPFHMPLTYASPEHMAGEPPGLDLALDPDRRDAAMRAADLHRVTLSGPVKLSNSAQLGLMMFAPFFAEGTAPLQPDRVNPLKGWITATVLASGLADGLRSQGQRELAVRLSDGKSVLIDELSGNPDGLDSSPMFSRTLEMSLYGRQWTFTFHSNLLFQKTVESRIPELVLGAGILINMMLLALFQALSWTHRLAVDIASTTTRRLNHQNAALERSHKELQTFAYVVSHDLRAPLQGITTLASFVEEELNDYRKGSQGKQDIEQTINKIASQVSRADALINGMLSYLHIGSTREAPEETDIRALVSQIAEALHLSDEQLSLQGEFPTIVTYRAQLDRVIGNLLDNAIQYHHDQANARITVQSTLDVEAIILSVSDDGPGIDERYHDRLFEPFETARSLNGADSTGVGLSIVKKTVEQRGGCVALRSTLAAGSTFTLRWPLHSHRVVESEQPGFIRQAA